MAISRFYGELEMLDQSKALCATCARGASRFAGRYHDFLLDPGTLFTLTSLLLLLAASIQDPGGLVSRNAAP